jgi:hypothetical protein
MGHLVLGLVLMGGIGLTIGAIFYQATKPRPGIKPYRQWSSYDDNGGVGGEAGGHDSGDGGH